MSEDNRPFHNPFGALGHLRERLPQAPANVEPPADARPTPPPTGRTYPRAVVRLERSGRGGKEVTVIEQLDLGAAEREVWLRELKAGLGCGGKVEADAIMLQGDHRDRLKALLATRGVRRVIIG